VDAAALMQFLSFASRALELNLEGFTHAESLVAPAAGGNCVNWMVGHLLVHRNRMLALLGAQEVWNQGEAARYDRGSEPLAPEHAEMLETLRAEMEAARERLGQALQSATPEALAQPAGNGTVGGRLMLLLGHELYHAGQIAILRRLSGREGAIR
jgi:uncharacterized damage-inducible protein DinB